MVKKRRSVKKRSLAKRPRDKTSGQMVRAIRHKLGMTKEAFAAVLKASHHTIPRWERDAEIPNDPNAILLLLLKRYPDMIKRLKNAQRSKLKTGPWIRAIRHDLQLSRKAFASKLWVSWKAVAEWERGEVIPQSPSLLILLMLKKYPDTLKRIEKFFPKK